LKDETYAGENSDFSGPKKGLIDHPAVKLFDTALFPGNTGDVTGDLGQLHTLAAHDTTDEGR
jgi:hypothetical protein